MNAHSCSRFRVAPTRAAQEGAALIEVLVSLLIFSFGILGMVAMLAKSLSTSIDAQDRSRAAVLANEIVTAMWMEGTNSPSTLTAWQSRVADATTSGLPNASGTATPSTDTTTGIVTTTVTITWQAPSHATGNTYTTSVVIP